MHFSRDGLSCGCSVACESYFEKLPNPPLTPGRVRGRACTAVSEAAENPVQDHQARSLRVIGEQT
eukprot:3774756-Prymnesium_polylepis.1